MLLLKPVFIPSSTRWPVVTGNINRSKDTGLIKRISVHRCSMRELVTLLRHTLKFLINVPASTDRNNYYDFTLIDTIRLQVATMETFLLSDLLE